MNINTVISNSANAVKRSRGQIEGESSTKKQSLTASSSIASSSVVHVGALKTLPAIFEGEFGCRQRPQV